VQSELYLGPQNGTADEAEIAAEKPDTIAFNGYVNQFDDALIRVRVGQRIRVWVADAGPQRTTSFHVLGTQFDTDFKERARLLRPGNAEHGASQVLDLAAPKEDASSRATAGRALRVHRPRPGRRRARGPWHVEAY